LTVGVGDFSLTNGTTFNTAGSTTTLSANQHLVIAGATQIASGATLTLDGGSLTSGSLTLAGNFSGNGVLAAEISGTSANVITANNSLTIGKSTSVNGFNFAGTLNIGGNAVILRDANTANLGALTTVSTGGSLTSSNGITLAVGDVVTASGAADINGDFVNLGTVNGATGSDFLNFTGAVTGTGNYTGNIQFSDEFRPGNSPGIVNLENMTLTSTSSLFIEIEGVLSSEFDQLLISNDAVFDGTFDVILSGGFNLDENMEFLVADVGGTQSGFFSGLDEGGIVVANNNGFDLLLSYVGGDGNDLRLYTAISTVPEPGTLGLVGCLTMGYFARRRWRKKQSRNLPPSHTT
jgi:hypothetical protein